jgi:hypothetical protein
MQSFNSIGEAVSALRAAVYSLPKNSNPELAKALMDAANEISPVVALANASEALYAYRDGLSPALLSLGAGLASLCAENDWHSIKDDRGIGMVRALRRDAGDAAPSGSWPKKTADPEIDSRFAPAPTASASAAPTPAPA